MNESSAGSEPADVVERFRLTADEDMLLTAWQYRMMQRDVAASRGKRRTAKRTTRDDFRNRVFHAVETETPEDFSTAVAEQLAARIRTQGPELRSTTFPALEDSAPALADMVQGRSRAMLLLIDLHGFEPWAGVTWTKSVRQDTLTEFRDALTPLRREDLAAVSDAYDSSVKALAAKDRRWGRVALFGAAGLGLGALTAGLAAPAVGALYGSLVLGYSGVVATNAGLAALGGGSLAAGGLGMAGGTALIAGAGGAAGLGAASAGAHALGLTAGQVAADVVRLEVATQLVLRDIEGDEQAAKAVVLALRERMLALRSQLVDLTHRIEQLKAERDLVLAEVNAERKARANQENTIQNLRAQLAATIQRDSSDASHTAFDQPLRALEAQKRASKVVADFVESRADLLERTA